VVQEGGAISFKEPSVALQGFYARPFVLGGNARTQLEVGRMASRTIERVLGKDLLRTKDGEPLLLSSLAMFGFLGANSVGEKLGPFFLTKTLKSLWTYDRQGHTLGHLAVAAEETLGPGRGEAAAREGFLKLTDAWPIFNRIDQIGRGRIGEGVGHLIKDIVGLDQLDY